MKMVVAFRKRLECGRELLKWKRAAKHGLMASNSTVGRLIFPVRGVRIRRRVIGYHEKFFVIDGARAPDTVSVVHDLCEYTPLGAAGK